MAGTVTMRNTKSKKGTSMRVIRTVAKLPGFALVIVLAMSGCREANEFQPPPPPKVTTAKPLVQTVVTYTEMPGQTRAIESVEVRARVEGFLQTVDFKEGAEVAQGALLYTIEPERYESAVKIAEARLANAKAVLVKAEFDLNRIRNLEAKQSAAKLEVVEAETGHSKANAEVAFAEAGLDEKKERGGQKRRPSGRRHPPREHEEERPQECPGQCGGEPPCPRLVSEEGHPDGDQQLGRRGMDPLRRVLTAKVLLGRRGVVDLVEVLLFRVAEPRQPKDRGSQDDDPEGEEEVASQGEVPRARAIGHDH